MASKTVRNVLNYALKQFVTTQRYREGLRTGNRASFHMEEQDAMTVLHYIVAKEGCPVEEAVKTFTDQRTAVLQAKVRSPKDLGFFGGLLMSFVLVIIPLVFLSTLEANVNMWLKVGLLAVTLIGFFALVLWLAWSPRSRAMKAVWKEGGSLTDRLEKLHQVQEMSFFEVIGEYQKAPGVIFGVLALVCIIGLPSVLGSRLAKEEAFHREMSAVVVSADISGDRYVVYDAEDKRYIRKYLPEDKQALTAQEVCAVIRLTEGKEVVGYYEGQGKAYQRYLTIELVDQRTGKTVYAQTVYGGEPPRSISVKSGARNQNGYGSHPAEADVTQTIQSMISRFEATK